MYFVIEIEFMPTDDRNRAGLSATCNLIIDITSLQDQIVRDVELRHIIQSVV